MYDLHLLDADLVFRRPPTLDEDLVDIEFADMEPYDCDDLVGVMPHEARATVPVEPYEMVGVIGHAAVATSGREDRRRRPFDGAPAGPDELETEEYYVI